MDEAVALVWVSRMRRGYHAGVSLVSHRLTPPAAATEAARRNALCALLHGHRPVAPWAGFHCYNAHCNRLWWDCMWRNLVVTARVHRQRWTRLALTLLAAESRRSPAP